MARPPAPPVLWQAPGEASLRSSRSAVRGFRFQIVGLGVFGAVALLLNSWADSLTGGVLRGLLDAVKVAGLAVLTVLGFLFSSFVASNAYPEVREDALVLRTSGLRALRTTRAIPWTSIAELSVKRTEALSHWTRPGPDLKLDLRLASGEVISRKWVVRPQIPTSVNDGLEAVLREVWDAERRARAARVATAEPRSGAMER